MASTSFGDSNSGFQVGNNNGSIEAQFHVTAERSKLYNTQGGAVFNGNLTANRDINIHNIVTIQPFAQSLYKSLFNSSDLFAQVRNELGLLVSVLNLTQEHTPKFQPDDPRLSELDDARDKCHDALRELVQLKDHFDDVGPQSQVTWERLGWGVEELVEIRTKLSIYIQALNVINCSISRSSIENVERMLKTFISEVRIGKRESAAMSSASNGSLTADERETWRQLRKELQDIGITPEIFAQHRGFILVSLQTLLTEEEREDYPVNLETPGSALEESTSERLPGATTRASKMAIGEVSPAFSTDSSTICDEVKPGLLARLLSRSTSLSNNSSETFGNGSCKHKTVRACQLGFTELCCACTDQRPISKHYSIYVDGKGLTKTTKRWLHYCPSCQDYFAKNKSFFQA